MSECVSECVPFSADEKISEMKLAACFSSDWFPALRSAGNDSPARVLAAAPPAAGLAEELHLNARVRADLLDCSRQEDKLLVSSSNEAGEALQVSCHPDDCKSGAAFSPGPGLSQS